MFSRLYSFKINKIYLLNNINILEEGLAIKHISKEYIKNIKIPIPSLEIQEQFIKEIEELNIN
jgi:type I restriction enzyme S subunit